MQFLSVLTGIVLGLVALAFVLYPFYRRSPAPQEPLPEQNGNPGAEVNQSLQAQAEREQAARAALQEVELDYQLGNIEEADYRTLRERYLRRALVALKSRYDHEQELDTAIEEKLRQMREREGHE